jgi:HAD superfamily hydrolase (TIGR01509 family)
LGKPCLLFDLDGTLVHTDPVHLKAFNAMLAPFGRSVDEEFYLRHVMGRQNAAIMRDVFPDLSEAEHRRLADEKEARFRALAGAGALSPLPGLLDLLAAAGEQDVACCIVTNAPRANAAQMLSAIGLANRFDVVVIGDELERAKPHPLPYLTGLSRLGGDADRSVAFEDSRSGVQAAAAAGLQVVGVSTSLDEPALIGAGASMVAPDFTDAAALALVHERTGLRI